MSRILSFTLAIIAAAVLSFSAPAFAGDAPPLAVVDDAKNVNFDAANGMMVYASAKPIADIVKFYHALAQQKGWTENVTEVNAAQTSLGYSVGDKDVLTISVMRLDSMTQVAAQGTVLGAAE